MCIKNLKFNNIKLNTPKLSNIILDNSIIKSINLSDLPIKFIHLVNNAQMNIEDCSQLCKLRLTDSSITDLRKLNKMTQLTDLSINNCTINENSLPLLPSLTNLEINDTKITSIANILEKCPNLTKLSILNASIKDINLLKPHTNLKDLFLNFNEIKTLEGINDMLPNLQILDLEENQLRNLKGIPKNLQHICACKNNLTDISHIKDCKYMHKLCIYNNKIKSIEALKYLQNLFYLVISNNEITSLEGLEQCKNLKYLSINGNNITSIKPVKDLNMSSLFISKDHNIKDLNLINSKIIKYK